MTYIRKNSCGNCLSFSKLVLAGSVFSKMTEIIFRVNHSSGLSCVYVAHVVIKREKTQFLLDFLDMHLKKKMSCDALGYSSKGGEKEAVWSLLLFPRVSRIHGWDSQCKHFSYEFQSHLAGGLCPSTANGQNEKSSGGLTQIGKHVCLAEGLLGGGREWVRMKKQMLSRQEFPFILFGHLAAPETLWQCIFSWEPFHKTSCDKCNTWLPRERADVGFFSVTSVAVADFLFFFFWKYL